MAEEARTISPENTSGTLIAATKVDGTSVFNRRGDHLGHVSNLMIDKKTGRVSYALMSFGAHESPHFGLTHIGQFS